MCKAPASRFEVLFPSGTAAFDLTAEDAGKLVTDALSLPKEDRPAILIVKFYISKNQDNEAQDG